MNSTDPAGSSNKVGIEALYSSLSDERIMLNEILWQAPVVSLTAQAFLLTIAFDPSPATGYRILAGVVASVIGFASWQLFLRHAACEKRISLMLAELDGEHFGVCYHGFAGKVPLTERIPWAANLRSRAIWAWCLFFISFCGLVPGAMWVQCKLREIVG